MQETLEAALQQAPSDALADPAFVDKMNAGGDTEGVVAVPSTQITTALDGASARRDFERLRLATIRSGDIPPVKSE